MEKTIENLIGFIQDLKIEAADLINQAKNSLTMGNKQAAESYLRASKIFNMATNNLRRIYLNSVAYNSIAR
jgi:hypothetical protein